MDGTDSLERQSGAPNRTQASIDRPWARILRIAGAWTVPALVAALILGISPARAAGVRYAKPEASGSGDCLSWENACILQTAIAGAVSGEEIWVMEGLHFPTASAAERTAAFQLKSGVAVYGGFGGTETARDQRDPSARLTVLSGDIDHNDSQTPVITDIAAVTGNATNSYRVVNGSTGAVLDGFTITAGNANGGHPQNQGAGMNNAGSSPVLANLVFIGNTAYTGGGMNNESDSRPELTHVSFVGNYARGGGGMFNEYSSPALTDVSFIGNSTPEDGDAGGMYNYQSAPTLLRVLFQANSADYGGGMLNRQSSPVLTDVVFHDNYAVYQGGGMENINGSSPALTNVTFSSNRTAAEGRGGGLRNYDGSHPVLTDVTFYGNSSTYGGGMESDTDTGTTLIHVTFAGNSASFGGAVFTYSGTNEIRNSLFWGNTAGGGGSQIYDNQMSSVIRDSVVQGGCPSGSTCTNVIADDPALGVPGDHGGFTRTIPILDGSSALDAADDSVCPAEDQRGVSRPQGSHCDIGAYEQEWNPTPTASNTPTPTATSTQTFSPTATYTPTVTPTPTATETATPTPTETATPEPVEETYVSAGNEDGYVRESSEFSGVGGTIDAYGSWLRAGDDSSDRQYRSILSFDTSALPDDAILLSAEVRVLVGGIVGVSPFGTHGALWGDLKLGYFGSSAWLEKTDFQSSASAAGNIAFSAPAGGTGWSTGVIPETGLPFVNRNGKTQIRIRFSLDDNDDRGNDYLNIYSGNAVQTNRPVIVIRYRLP